MPIFKLVLLALVAYLSKAGSPGKDVYPVLNPEVSVDFASGSKQSVAPLTSELTITANHTNESEIPQKRAAEHQHENEEILEHKQQTEEPIYDSELKDMFDKFDEDSNGYLNRQSQHTRLFLSFIFLFRAEFLHSIHTCVCEFQVRK